MSIDAGTIANIASAVASAFSAAIAWSAVRQATRTATFAAKGEAINYVHAAVAALNRGQSSTTLGDLLQNIQKAKQLADRVFSLRVRTELNDKLKAARSLSEIPTGWGSFIKELEDLIARMNAEAYVGG